MAPAKIDLDIWKGQTFHKEFIWKDSTGMPVDLSFCTARMQIRPTKMASTVVVELTTENQGITLVPAEGRIVLDISAEDSAAIKVLVGEYDLEIVRHSGQVRRLFEGKVRFHNEVTR